MQDELTKIISQRAQSNFLPSFFFLNEEKKNAMHTVYNFCRYTDDIADSKEIDIDKKTLLLKKWRYELEKSLKNNSDYMVLNKLGKVIEKFNIPLDPFFDLIKGMEMDLQKKEFVTFADLLEYCYNVASTVGLMTIEIFGYRHQNTKQYAVNLGIALQLTNILRDLKEDAKEGRIYLPGEDLLKFNYPARDLFENKLNNNFTELMKFQYNRAESYFQKADSLFEECDKRNLLVARIMEHFYHRILQKIHKKKYDVYNNKIRISGFRKACIGTGVWLKYSLLYR